MAKGMRDIKRQIKSTQNMKQITKAMEMIASARLRRAQEAAQSARPYAEKLREVIGSISSAGGVNHPMLEKRPIKRTGYIVITSDRGLAGGYNANLLRKVMLTIREKHKSNKDEYLIYVLGRKGRDFLRRRGIPIAQEIVGLPDFPRFSDIRDVANGAVKAYEEGTIDELVLVYNEFRSVISQTPVDKTLLPLGETEKSGSASASYEFEPSPEVVLNHILPRYAETLVYSAVLEGKASEFGARMTAMSNASKNATKFINSLTLQYNRARQASITQEITEIVAGANAQG
ncbi:ATP synthase F1 subunit gamma [Paenibacillus antri]|uniref:ATP synthase gamma chain n=1 Tax=Paenibacillus antri TaxID=2582848 RepID=A0A5R9G2D9_9BACL|nr:ATP synthase F1 subunit gamma [Paenibacillus antri]TLS50522.1 ATP synthase F1 subunit gamma [Paenibacillus antri]